MFTSTGFQSLIKVKASFLIVALVFLTFLGFNSKSANAAITSLGVTIVTDGTAPFDATSGAGFDTSANNSIVRANDLVEYLISYNADSTAAVQLVVTTSSPTMFWDASTATSSQVCNGTGGGVLSNSNRTLTCNRNPSIGLESFNLRAKVWSGANNSVVTVSALASGKNATSPEITISATPKNDMRYLSQAIVKSTINGVKGMEYQWVTGVGALGDVNTIKGVEALSRTEPITFTIDVPPLTVVTACNSFAGGGTRTCSQPGGPGTQITVTITGANTSFSSGSTPGYLAGLLAVNQTELKFFTPFGTAFPENQVTFMSLQIRNFDPNSLSGVSNYGSGFASGMSPSFNCPTNTSVQGLTSTPCIGYFVNRKIIVNPAPTFPGAISGNRDDFIFGDNDALTNNNGAGAESVVIGQKFRALQGVQNTPESEDPANNVASCMVWDPELMELNGIPKLYGGSGTYFHSYLHLSKPLVASNKFIIEYSAVSYASDAARRATDCGVAGDGSTNWFTNPSLVPGGQAAVSSIRFKYLDPLNPNSSLGLEVPLKRSLSAKSQALATGAVMPWFFQYRADGIALRKSTYTATGGPQNLGGGRVNAISAMVRHEAALSSTDLAPGTVTTYLLTPKTIGPTVAGINGVATATKIKVTLPTATNVPKACFSPVVSSLPAGTVVTPANLGPDGLACTTDDISAAVVELNLGDLTAFGGALSPAPYDGHVEVLPTVSFQMLAAVNTPVANFSATSVISSVSDISPVGTEFSSSPAANGKVRNVNLLVNGVSAFSVDKSASGVTNGKVGPNEIFSYTINFGNGGSGPTGVGRFVDVLPFDGDRNGTSGLGTGKLIVQGLSASMASPAQGTVTIQTSTDSPLTVQSAVTQSGNEDASVGVNWTNFTGGVIPSGVTAVRFITSQGLNSGFSGFGTIQVKAPTIDKSTSITNAVWGRTDPIASNNDTIKILDGKTKITIQGLDGATLRGRVFIDLNENGNQEGTETGLPNTLVVITCTTGSCLSAPQGTVFSVLTDANGGFGFEPNLVNKIFPNQTASGVALGNFQGVIAGTWTITETPPNTQPFVNVSTTPGTVNSVNSGSKSGRSITSLVMVGNGIGVNYNFGERLEHGKITVTAKPITLPAGVTGPFAFEYEATCDLPVANSKFSATLTNFPTNNKVDIVNIPAGASCTLTEKVPTPPAGFVWDVPSFTALTPTGTMAPGGTQTSDVTNALISGFTVQKEVLSGPTPLVAQNTKHEITYRISVINRLAAEQTYSLSDALGFDPDVTIVGTPTVTTSSNVSNSLNAGFTGLASNTQLISNEKVSAGSSAVPTIETYDIKVTIDQTKVSSANDSCNAAAGNGLFNTATMSFGSSSVTANACTNTPSLKPVEFVMQVFWESGRVGAQMNVPGIEFAVSSAAANTMSSTNFGPGTRTSGDSLTVKVGDSGILPGHSFVSQEDNPYHKISPWRCNEELFSPGDRYTVPTTAAGSQTGVVCVLTIKGLSLGTTKTAVPESGKSVAVDDVIEYTLTTNLDGAELQEDFVLKDTLGSGLTFFGTTPDGCEVNKQVLTCTVPSRSLPGEYKFVYKAKVDQDADTISSTGISNKVVSSLGACDSCSTLHTMWTADTKKVSDAAGKKGVRIGDNIRYTVSVTIKNGPSTQAITVKDTRSVGLLVTKVPDGCSQNGRVITCVVPAGSANGVHSFIYNATVTKDAGDYVTNKAVSDKGTCLTSCSTTVKVLKEVVLRVTKTNNVKQVKIGDFVRYEILVENLSDIDANEFFILDKAAPGLSYVEGSVRVTGDASWSVQSNYPLKIAQLDLEAGKKLTISYLMRVGAGAGRGKLSNQAWADDDQDFVSSNIATASVTRGSDPDFEDTHIMGVVFEDRNGNGIQDESEPGIAGARLTTAQGLIVETDAFGRYHIEGIDPGALARGSNYVVKLDTNSIPKGSKLTTQNPLVKRLTHGIPVVFNFGIR